MKLLSRDILIILAVAALAVLVGFQIASDASMIPVLLGGAFCCAIIAYISPIGFNPLALGALLIGYVLGNRGFAQFSLSANLPLFPAELGISATLAILLWHCAQERKLPWKNDFLNYTLLFWMALSTVRLPFDVRTYGAMALRDYAMVYYGLFFFIAQESLTPDASWRWLRRCLLTCTALLPFLYAAFNLWPWFFLDVLTVRGLPLIYFKGDLAGTFMSVGALAWFWVFERQRTDVRTHSIWLRAFAALIAVGLVIAMVFTENRAAMLALIAGLAVMLLGRRWRFAATLVGASALAVVAILFWAQATGRSWERTPLYGLSQRVVSVVDYQGARDYSGAEGAESKGDNNKFRAVWWETVIDETVTENPWTGLGYGHDLAESFLRAYYADSSDAFTARSPHNLILSIFARTGAVGLAAFLMLCCAMAWRTWRATRPRERFESGHVASASSALEPWCYVWAIFVSACLGVVLEGPMGAVVFWILLGAAAARGQTKAPARTESELPETTSAVAVPSKL